MERESRTKIVEEIVEEKFGDYFSSYLAGKEREYERIGIEELKAQRELMEARFEASDRRFEDLIHYMDKRFEAVDKRFEDLIHHMDQRFEGMNRRFTMLTWLISSLFGALALLIIVFKFVK